jgi:hypothetical protein
VDKATSLMHPPSPTRRYFVLLLLFCLAETHPALPQDKTLPNAVSDTKKTSIPSSAETKVRERRIAVDFLHDQKDIWTSPLKLRRKDLFWVVPSGLVVGGLIYRDVDAYRGMSVNDAHAATSKTFSDAGVVGMGGLSAGLYFYGLLRSDDHSREAGLLSAEAVADSMAVDFALKYALGRERPFQGNGQGNFFHPGRDSFPSGHAIAAWSMASVLAHEYPGLATKLGVYGLASAVSFARVTGRQHFPTDVVVGSALGWFIGDHVYKTRHREDQVGVDYGTFHSAREERTPSGSPYVRLDSWVYPAIDRLISMGFINSAMTGMKPWTRFECSRLVDEATAASLDSEDPSVIQSVARLNREFGSSNEQHQAVVSLDSLYFRALGISGKPLNDGYHLGQTIYNDLGRPYQQGFNHILGASGSANYGPWAFYVQAEYQHAPDAVGLSPLTATAIGAADATPPPSTAQISATNRARLLDAYVSFTTQEWQFSLGKQSLWWGPGNEGAMNLSNNAEPIPMFRISRVKPLTLPSLFSLLGPVRTEFFWGQLSGHQFVRTSSGLFGPGLENQPLIHGEKISFKPTPNLEIGFSETTMWGGPGLLLNLHAFFNSYSLGNTDPGQGGDPGDRRTGFDFSYRLPKLRDKMMLYGDSFTEDEFSPIAYPRKSSFRAGIYVPALPWVHKMDFRSEGVYTDIPNLNGSGIAYSNNRFLGGFTNSGQILGDWIGREGAGFTASSTYWISAVRKARLAYRNINVNPDFVGGGRYDDFSGNMNWELNARSAISASAQYERWHFPVLRAAPRSDTSVSIMFMFHPGKRLHPN